MRGGQNLETWIGRDIWSGRDWDTYVKPFYEKIGVKISPVNSELQKVSDKVSSMFNESDLNRIVKRVVNEQKSKPFVDVYNSNKITRLIKESAEAMVSDAKEQMSGGDEPDKGIMDKITSCIKKNKLSNLMVLTTGAGAYALGLIAILMGTGVGAPLALMMSGAILIILEGIGINGQSASSEVSTLMKCMGY
jgi:hypothetical protein